MVPKFIEIRLALTPAGTYEWCSQALSLLPGELRTKLLLNVKDAEATVELRVDYIDRVANVRRVLASRSVPGDYVEAEPFTLFGFVTGDTQHADIRYRLVSSRMVVATLFDNQ